MALNLNYTTYGNQSNLADAIVINFCEDRMWVCEFDSTLFMPLFIYSYTISQANLNQEILKAFNYFQLDKKKYNAVYVNYFSANFTLCPNAFYDEENKKNLLEFNCGKIENQLVLTNDVSTSIKLIYSIPETLKSLLNQTFPNHHLKHSSCVLSQLMLTSKEFIRDTILLSVNDSHVELVVKKDQQLIMANQFAVKTEQDVLYYLLFLIEQYQFDTKTVSVAIIGNIGVDSELYSILKKYIRNIRLASGHKNLNYGSITGMPQHFNFTLLNRLFCE